MAGLSITNGKGESINGLNGTPVIETSPIMFDR
jgi:hypothetical protein